MAVGVAFLLAPGLAGKLWVGSGASQPETKILGRAFGARDLGLGLGVVIALDRGTPVRGWLEACAMSDAADGVASLLGLGTIPPALRPGALAIAGGSAAVASWLSRQLDPDPGGPLEGQTPEAAVTGHPDDA